MAILLPIVRVGRLGRLRRRCRREHAYHELAQLGEGLEVRHAARRQMLDAPPKGAFGSCLCGSGLAGLAGTRAEWRLASAWQAEGSEPEARTLVQ